VRSRVTGHITDVDGCLWQRLILAEVIVVASVSAGYATGGTYVELGGTKNRLPVAMLPTFPHRIQIQRCAGHVVANANQLTRSPIAMPAQVPEPTTAN
jgi:hypothetical protein